MSILLLFLYNIYFVKSSVYTTISNIRDKIEKFPSIPDLIEKFYYNEEELIYITVKSIQSSKNQIPYDYFYLDLCNPQKRARPSEGISELLTGKRMSYSNYFLYMNRNETCAETCTKNFTSENIKKYQWLIDRNYYVTYYLDKLPSGYKFTYFDWKENKKKTSINYLSGIPLGFKKNNIYYIYNHFVFNIFVNRKENKYQIVDFSIEPYSVEQTGPERCINFQKNISIKESSNNNNFNFIDFSKNNKELEENQEDSKYYLESYYQELKLSQIGFTYDIIFLPSNITFSSRYDHYFTSNKNIHWLGLIYSNLLIFSLTIALFIILKRIVNKDLENYNNKVSTNEIVTIDEYGWKQINGDVFRKPKKLMLLSAFIGTGVEILCIFLVSLIFTLIGFIKPEIRGNMFNYMVYSFFLFGIISGYVSTFVYKNCGGKEWLKNCIFTSFLFPFIALVILGTIRILMSFEKSSAGFKISQMTLLCLLWLFVSSPLVFAGTLLCVLKRPIKLPCKVNALPTTIGKKPWFLHLQYSCWLMGIIPFATLFIEFIYLMSYLWKYQIYYMASFLSLSIFFEVIMSSEISVVYVFINLCKGDYNWWWKSFFVGASPAIYIFIYSIYYFFYMSLTRLSAIVIYFLIMGLITVVCTLMSGACCSLITFWFIYFIYSKIKID